MLFWGIGVLVLYEHNGSMACFASTFSGDQQGESQREVAIQFDCFFSNKHFFCSKVCCFLLK